MFLIKPPSTIVHVKAARILAHSGLWPVQDYDRYRQRAHFEGLLLNNQVSAEVCIDDARLRLRRDVIILQQLFDDRNVSLPWQAL
ncbi:hypothetical protein M514_24217 [Trichuris suis]|uniref:Uncharacterized protein n=1 Tax=Trichuris suis TaxID=68888 RepID=A0A085N295_9BILA|nr:hypothetical protein M514_24217 [Trichuris suis]